MFVPKILRKEVLTTCHDTRYAAHFGVSKIYLLFFLLIGRGPITSIPTLSIGWPTKYFCKAAFDFLFKDLNLLQTEQHLSKNDAIFYQMFVPKILRKEVLTTCHDTRYAAHFGVSKTLNKVKQDFHWYKMAEDVKLHVKCCSVCNRFKSLNKKSKAALQKYLVGHPMDRVG
jgi:hypothetical protein